MSTAPTLPSVQEIQNSYNKLAGETGDLYFRIEELKSSLAAHEARMAILKGEREALGKLLVKAKLAEVDSVGTVEPSAS